MSTLDETRIAALVDRFYDKVRADASIGPIFNAAVHDWAEHKELLTRFWCSVALGAHSYRGNPMAVHRGQPAIRAVHFARWLELWRETTGEVLDADDAAQMQDYADRIGRSLRMGMGLPERLDVRPLGIPVVGVGRS
jgi:hemoglobin